MRNTTFREAKMQGILVYRQDPFQSLDLHEMNEPPMGAGSEDAEIVDARLEAHRHGDLVAERMT